jgi:hypothetical protein
MNGAGTDRGTRAQSEVVAAALPRTVAIAFIVKRSSHGRHACDSLVADSIVRLKMVVDAIKAIVPGCELSARCGSGRAEGRMPVGPRMQGSPDVVLSGHTCCLCLLSAIAQPPAGRGVPFSGLSWGVP